MADPLTLLILPGLDGTGRLLDRFVAALPDTWTVKVMRYNVEEVDYPQITQRVIAEFPKGDVVVVAESFSGPIGHALLKAEVPNLRGVVFAASFVTRPSFWPAMMINALKAVPFRQRFFLRLGKPLFMGGVKDPALFALFSDIVAQVPKATFIARLKSVHRLPIVDVVLTKKPRAVPTLFLKAGRERFLSNHRGKQMTQLADHTVTLKAPHFLLQCVPEQASAAIQSFVASRLDRT